MNTCTKLSVFLLILIILSNSCNKEDNLPVIITSAVTNISDTGAVCGGTITSDGGKTITARGVCYSTSIKPSIADNKTNDGAGAGSFSSYINDLIGGTNYFVRAYATNSSGTGYGMAMSFKTSGQPPTAPTVITSVATNVQTNSATLNAIVNANYFYTNITFEYGTTVSYGNTITAIQSPLTGHSAVMVNVDITGLTAATTYHFRVKAVNSLGTTFGNDMSFITLGGAPKVTTQAATNILPYSATLNGLVNPNYLLTTVIFQYGTTISYGQSTIATQSPITGGSNKIVSTNISGLTTGTLYHYRIKSENERGVTYGEDMTFTTLTP